MNVHTDTDTRTASHVADEIWNEHDVQVQSASRVAWTVITVLGLFGVAGVVATDGVNGLLALITALTAVASTRVLKAHDRLKIARARLGA